MSNQLKNLCLCYLGITITPLIEEENLIPLTQCSLLVEHNFSSSCHNLKKRLMQTVALMFVVEPKHLILECTLCMAA